MGALPDLHHKTLEKMCLLGVRRQTAVSAERHTSTHTPTHPHTRLLNLYARETTTQR